MDNFTIETIKDYKNQACELVRCDCNKCEAMYKCQNGQWCCFDTVIRFINYIKKIEDRYADLSSHWE